MDLDEILQGGDDVEDDIDSILLNFVAKQLQNGGRLNI
jgi:hypothetical protein